MHKNEIENIKFFKHDTLFKALNFFKENIS